MKIRIIVAAVIEKNGTFLFGKKAHGVGPYPDKWLILGGGVNLGEETLDEGLKREIQEEGNIEITNLNRVMFDEDIREKNGEMIHHIFLTYKADWLAGEIKPGDDIETLRWIPKAELKSLDVAKVTIRVLQKLELL